MNDEKGIEKRIELKKRTPGEKKAFVQGFEHAFNMFSYHLRKESKEEALEDMSFLLYFFKDAIEKDGDNKEDKETKKCPNCGALMRGEMIRND